MDRYAKTFAVRWADCDANGHMRNTAYSEYCIEVRMTFLAEAGFGWERFLEHGVGPVILREEIDYLREVRLHETFEVDFQQLGLALDGSRFRLAHDVVKADGKKAARIVLNGGWLDMRTRRLAVPPRALVDAIRRVPRADGYAELPAISPRGETQDHDSRHRR